MNSSGVQMTERMAEREWQIAIFGTFDVENYGDLLFPVLAEAELAKRLGSVKLHRFSYHARTQPDWPYDVTSLTELPALAASLDGVLIGGGFIIRFDKVVAVGYLPPVPEIHHPTGYWLTPALIALQHDIPLIWNAPGMHCNDIPEWAEPLVKMALEHSRHVRVRDALSQEALAPFAGKTEIAVLPDTAFGISRLIDEQHPSAEFMRLREAAGLTGPYIVIHTIRGMEPVLRLIKSHADLFQGYRFLLLPIGPVLGDHESIAGDDLPGSVCLAYWPSPLLLAEFIAHAQAVVGHSYHLMITALACGVPVFSTADLTAGKYTALAVFETVHPLIKDAEIDPQWFLSRVGKIPPNAAAVQAADQVAEHWDQVAAIIREGPANTQIALNRYWQSLPNYLEAVANRAAALEAERAAIRDCQAKLASEHNDLLATIQAQTERTSALEVECERARAEVAALLASSAKPAAPSPGIIMRGLKRLAGK